MLYVTVLACYASVLSRLYPGGNIARLGTRESSIDNRQRGYAAVGTLTTAREQRTRAHFRPVFRVRYCFGFGADCVRGGRHGYARSAAEDRARNEGTASTTHRIAALSIDG